VCGCGTAVVTAPVWCQVMRGEEFPADIVFLSAMHDDPEQRGMCHVQTAQLDGETNLKLRKAPDETVAVFTTDHACSAFTGVVECEHPTEHFGKFTGKLLMNSGDKVGAF
jgi:magnesium-transporting ATPase (P-type)